MCIERNATFMNHLMFLVTFCLLSCSVSCSSTPEIVRQNPPEIARRIEIPDSPGFNSNLMEGDESDHVPKSEGDKLADGNRYKVNISLLNVRSGPGMSYSPVRQVKGGTILTIEECTQIWCRIKDGEYIVKRHLEPLIIQDGESDRN